MRCLSDAYRLLPSGKRLVDVTIRYGFHPSMIDRWKKILDIKAFFEQEIGCSVYDLLPGVVENSFYFKCKK